MKSQVYMLATLPPSHQFMVTFKGKEIASGTAVRCAEQLYAKIGAGLSKRAVIIACSKAVGKPCTVMGMRVTLWKKGV